MKTPNPNFGLPHQDKANNTNRDSSDVQSLTTAQIIFAEVLGEILADRYRGRPLIEQKLSQSE